MATPADNLPIREAQDRFVAVWGQMAGAWGISRTMAEIHALLYITGEELCTDDIMDRLQISRGNASMSLRSLLDWGIVLRAHKRGDRKEYFAAEQDVWTMFRAIVRERIKREVDPLLASLHEIKDISAAAGRGGGGDPAALKAHTKRLDDMLAFFETLETLGHRFVSPAGRGLRVAATLLATMAPRQSRRASAGVAVEPAEPVIDLETGGLDGDGLEGGGLGGLGGGGR